MKLKKLFAGLLSLAAALIAVCAITVCAGAETSGDYEYIVLEDGTVEITDYTGSETDLYVPSTIDGRTVTRIGASAFSKYPYPSSLSSIHIPDSVTSIGALAFEGTRLLDNQKKSTLKLNCSPFVRQYGIIEIHQNKSLTKGGIFMPKGKPNKRYTPEFKIKVVETMQKEKLSYHETARQFDINNHHIVARWERIYLEEGPEGLRIERRGRKSTGRPPKLNKKVEEDLVAEVQRLRAENDYLKKLNALVAERVRQEKKRK